jgi:DNA-directed RNA polymerase specialized sigma24 family protein
MRSDDEALRRFVADRFPRLCRSAFLMCGDWAYADEQARATVARLVADSHRGVEDPDAYAWWDLMRAFRHRPGQRERIFADARGDTPETVLQLDALHRLAPLCRAVLVMRHAEGFAPDEVADVLGITEDRVAAYEAAGLRALRELGDRSITEKPTHEPPIGDAVEDIFRRAEAVRRRRIRVLLAGGALAVVGIAATGYALTALLLPTTVRSAPAVAGSTSATTDPVLEVVRPVLEASGLRVVALEPARGDGWRRYRALTPNGRARGVIEISTYTAARGLCFPVRGHPGECAQPEVAAGGVGYARYADDRDVDWQVNEAIARFADGRVVVVQATGERGTRTAAAGRPALSAVVAARIATDPRIAVGVGDGGSCNAPDSACPVLRVPVRPAGG